MRIWSRRAAEHRGAATAGSTVPARFKIISRQAPVLGDVLTVDGARVFLQRGGVTVLYATRDLKL